MHGASVGLAERTELGGTCVNVGCVPKKVRARGACPSTAYPDPPTQIMYTIANYFEERRGGLFGMTPPEPDLALDWADFKRRRDAYVSRLNGIYLRNLETSGVALHRGNASFVDERTLRVGDETVTVRGLPGPRAPVHHLFLPVSRVLALRRGSPSGGRRTTS